jgi:hypothetical protein
MITKLSYTDKGKPALSKDHLDVVDKICINCPLVRTYVLGINTPRFMYNVIPAY